MESIKELKSTIRKLDKLRDTLLAEGWETIRGSQTSITINNFKDVLNFWLLEIEKESEND